MTYPEFLAAVDLAVRERTGLGTDAVDFGYWECWDAGLDPADVVADALELDGWGAAAPAD